MKMEIPDKLYFKIGEVAKIAAVPAHVLRYWESKFVTIKPKRTGDSNQRLYRREDVVAFLTIKTLLHEQGFTIAGAKKFILREKPLPASHINSHPPHSSYLLSSLRTIKQKLFEIKLVVDNE